MNVRQLKLPIYWLYRISKCEVCRLHVWTVRIVPFNHWPRTADWGTYNGQACRCGQNQNHNPNPDPNLNLIHNPNSNPIWPFYDPQSKLGL